MSAKAADYKFWTAKAENDLLNIRNNLNKEVIMRRAGRIFWIIVLCAGIAVSACSSSSEEKEAPDMSLTFEKDKSCKELTGIRLEQETEKKLKKVVASETEIEEWPIVVDWDEMDEGILDLSVFLTAGGESEVQDFQYDLEISKEWGGEGTFTAVCEPEYAKPVLLFDLAKVVAVFSVAGEECTFGRVELYEVFKDMGPGRPGGREYLFTGPIKNRRSQYFWHEPSSSGPELLIKLVEVDIQRGEEIEHEFTFQTDTKLGQRFDFTIDCDPAVMELKIGDQSFEPSRGPDGDRDLDGGADTNGDVDGGAGPGPGETGDGDEPTSGPDGDGESITEGDFDASEIEGSDGDQHLPDGDLDSPPLADEDVIEGGLSEEAAEGEESPACGSERPTNFIVVEGEDEDVLMIDECRPSGKVGIHETSNILISGGRYVRLDAVKAGGELVFKVAVESTWRYYIRMHYVGGADREEVEGDGWGIVELYLDDGEAPLLDSDGESRKNLSMPLSPSLDVAPKEGNYRPVCLKKGEHRLRIKVVDTESDGYTIGLDRIYLNLD